MTETRTISMQESAHDAEAGTTGTSVVLEVDHVSKSYDSPSGVSVDVLKGVSLCVRAGESIAITGPSGSGKSTLLNLMGGLDVPTTGSVRVGGRELNELTEKELAAMRNRQIGFIFQLHHLLPQCTVLENVLVPVLPGKAGKASDEEVERAMRLLGRVGLQNRMEHRPGLLSGGECQRVAVVRALINEPAILLADEPTGALDHATADELCELLIELNREQGTALVVVTHSMELSRRMDRHFTLRDGTLTPGSH